MLSARADLVEPGVQRVHRVRREVIWAVEELDGFGVDRSVDAEDRDRSKRSRASGQHSVLKTVKGVVGGAGAGIHAIKRHGVPSREHQLVDALTELHRKFLEREVCSWHGDVAFETSIFSGCYGYLVLVSLVGIAECSLSRGTHLVQHERFGCVQVDLVVISLELLFVLQFVSKAISVIVTAALLTLAWMSLSLMDEKACWFDVIVLVVDRTVLLDVVVVDEMYVQERSFACALMEILQTCDREINEANGCLE